MSLDADVWGALFKPPADDRRGLGGYRFGRLEEDADGFCLTGLGAGHGYVWKAGLNQATCNHSRHSRSHSVPGKRCTCGFHACHTPEMLIRTVGPNDQVLCGVSAKGRIVVHEYGWRSQYAAIVGIADQVPGRIVRAQDGRVLRITRRIAAEPEVLQQIARRYGVPLLSVLELEQLLCTYRMEV